jgi:chitin disaccharide deacetylase
LIQEILELTPSYKSQTNRLLGYPADARLLIINADDLGMCHAVNEAVFRTFQNGVLCSTTLMVPCPWTLHASHFLAEHREIPFGIHLTVISDWVDYRWGPITSREKAFSLLNKDGTFHSFEQMLEFPAQVNMGELELEFWAQIETVLAAGLDPTHIDWHSLRIGGREDIFDLMFQLAREYSLALRVYGRSSIEKVQRQGLPVNDSDFLDSHHLDPAKKLCAVRSDAARAAGGFERVGGSSCHPERGAAGHRVRRQSLPPDRL